MKSFDANRARRYVAVAEVARPHGVLGELKVAVYNLESDLLLGKPSIRLAKDDGTTEVARIRSVRRVPGAMLMRLEGVNDRDRAETLRGARIEVPREELGEVEPGEFYHCDLEGCEVRTAERVGVVARVVSYPTCDALVVVPDQGGQFEVPLTDAYVVRVDVDAGIIELSSLPE